MKSTNIPYLPQVDHLRALAAVWIVLYHGMQTVGAGIRGQAFDPSHWRYTDNPLLALFLEGHTAVSLFMVLSGFIFTHGALGRRVMYVPFVVNRLLRIYPLYLFVGLWLVSARSAAGVPVSLESLVVTALPLSNMRWANASEVVPLSWAVAVEFQFYLLFPVILARFNDRPVRVAAAVIGTALAFRVLAVMLGSNPRELVHWHLIGRIDYFVLGMVAALAHARLGRRAAAVALAAAVPAVLVVLFTYNRAGGWPSTGAWKVFWPTIEGGVWALFVFGYVGAVPDRPRPLSRVLAGVGEVSYSMYLLHWLLIVPVTAGTGAFPRWTGDSWLDGLAAAALILLPLTVAVSLVTFRVIERPFLRLRVRYLAEPDRPPPA